MASGAAGVSASKEDEFEEFDEDNWTITNKEDPELWDFEWDTDQVDEEFAAALQAELEKEAAAASAPTGAAATETTEE